jgi:hypothetical protein
MLEASVSDQRANVRADTSPLRVSPFQRPSHANGWMRQCHVPNLLHSTPGFVICQGNGCAGTEEPKLAPRQPFQASFDGADLL